MKRNFKREGLFEGRVKRPIRRTLLIISIVIILVLSGLATSVLYSFVSSITWQENSNRLTDIATYVESKIDADDLKECRDRYNTLAEERKKATGELTEEDEIELSELSKSPKYVALQQGLNHFIDQFDIAYLYIVIPSKEGLINVISATSQEERDAGEDDLRVGEVSDAYSEEELKRYSTAYDSKEMFFFEETSEWGTYFTACKTMYDSNGERVGLICVDRDIEDVRGTIAKMMIAVSFSIFGATLLFALFVGILIRKKVTGPIFALEKSSRNFANDAEKTSDVINVNFVSPQIRTGNEVQSLAEAVEYMANSVKENAQKTIEAEQEKAAFAEKSKSAERIAKLSESIVTLLDNMPVMTFYKDIETGKYVACNQSFAEHCGKETPADISGLTDYDVFDPKAAEHYIECDKIALSMDKPYVFFEDVPSADGDRRQFQTTKLKFTDADGNTRLLGMCVDVTEMMKMQLENKIVKEAYEEAKNESLTYARIANALSNDYIYLYYINTETDEFIEYHSDKDHDNLALERKGKDFFNASLNDAKKMIYKEDHAVFSATFKKENVLEKISQHGMFTITYRLLLNGKPTFVNMKATKLSGDDNHIIIGVNSIDAQIKDQEEMKRINEERITYSRITALSGNYICIYTVNPETDEYIEYSSTTEYEGLGLAKKGKDFFERARSDGDRFVYAPDQDLFRSVMQREKVLKEVRERGMFVVDYRLLINGVPTYVALKATLVEENDGPQLIVGVINIDARVKREQEYAQNLYTARKQADSDALTGLKNKHAYIDLESQINQTIEDGAVKPFAVAIFDVNGLKTVNDTQGHVAGDEYIRNAGKMICDEFKHSPVFRVGGDEFAVIAQGVDCERTPEHVRKIEEKNAKNRATGEVTVACGYAVYDGDRDVSSVFKRADALMYENKRRLKNG